MDCALLTAENFKQNEVLQCQSVFEWRFRPRPNRSFLPSKGTRKSWGSLLSSLLKPKGIDVEKSRGRGEKCCCEDHRIGVNGDLLPVFQPSAFQYIYTHTYIYIFHFFFSLYVFLVSRIFVS